MTAELTELNAVAAELPPDLVRKVTAYARMLKTPYWELPGYSSEWTEEDMRDATLATMRAFEAEHPDEDWGDLKPMNPGEISK